jgi:hypothetical protein
VSVPAEQLAIDRAEGWTVSGDEVAGGRVLRCFVRCDADDVDLEVASDHLGDLAGRYAFIADGVQLRACRSMFQRKAGEACVIDPVHGCCRSRRD